MSVIKRNTFTAYQLSEEEEKAAVALTTSTIQYLYSLRAGYAEEKVQLAVDTSNVQDFIQKEASLQGSIAVLTYLIDLAETAQQEESDARQSHSQQ